jgi:hypothetical protein
MDLRALVAVPLEQPSRHTNPKTQKPAYLGYFGYKVQTEVEKHKVQKKAQPKVGSGS